MTSDTISDFLIRIKNAYAARQKAIEVPYGKALEQIGKILKDEGFLGDVRWKTREKRKVLLVALLYQNRKPALLGVSRISKPGLRVYVSKKRIPIIFGGAGLVVVSTPKGIMSGKKASKKNLGGELICKVW